MLTGMKRCFFAKFLLPLAGHLRLLDPSRWISCPRLVVIGSLMLQLCDNKDTLNLKNTQTIYRAPCECIFSSHGMSRADMGGAGTKFHDLNVNNIISQCLQFE